MLWRVGQWPTTPLQVWMCLSDTGALDEHHKKKRHWFSSWLRTCRHSTAFKNYLLGCGGWCSGQQCLCRSPCKFLIRVNWMNSRNKLHRLSSKFRGCGHSQLFWDWMLCCGGWGSGPQPLCRSGCVFQIRVFWMNTKKNVIDFPADLDLAHIVQHY